MLKANGDMLMMRVESDDLIGSYSIRTLIEGHLVEVEDLTNMVLLWVPAKLEPFESLSDYIDMMKKSTKNGGDNDGDDEGVT